jgi:catalase (peroxidase I)
VFEAANKENTSLQSALNALKKIKEDVARTNVVSLGDLIAFGGAVVRKA